jgi:predicted dehydrogenase
MRQLDVNPLISQRSTLDNFGEIYENMAKSDSIASILTYPHQSQEVSTKVYTRALESSKGSVGIIGAGNFTSSTVLPKLKSLKAPVKFIASSGGLSAVSLAKKFNIPVATSDYSEILNDPEINLVIITTRHDTHATIAQEALKAGKNIFIEKPLCLTESELDQIIETYGASEKMVVVGFNRRFSQYATKLKSNLNPHNPINIIATMNAGFIPSDHWTQDLDIGGGRIIGEAVHYIDLCTYLAGSLVKSVCMNSLGVNSSTLTDNASILLKYENGTNAVINYLANGSKKYPKERIEVHTGNSSMVIDNWRMLKTYGIKGLRRIKSNQDKGHQLQFNLLLESIEKGGEPIIPFHEIVNTSKASFAAIRSLAERRWVDID